MNITLEFTTTLFDYIHQQLRPGALRWQEVALRVGRVALAAILLPFSLLLDIPLAIYRICSHHKLPARDLQQGGVPHPDLVNRVVAAPSRGNFSSDRLDHKQFFKDSLAAAFELQDPETKALYKQFIKDDDVEAFDIYKWTAGCLLAHHFRLRSNFYSVGRLYPKTHPDRRPMEDYSNNRVLVQRQQEIISHTDDIDRLYSLYRGLNKHAKAVALLKIMVLPSIDWKFTEETQESGQNFVNQVNNRAQLMTQDPTFRQAIYTKQVEYL